MIIWYILFVFEVAFAEKHVIVLNQNVDVSSHLKNMGNLFHLDIPSITKQFHLSSMNGYVADLQTSHINVLKLSPDVDFIEKDFNIKIADLLAVENNAVSWGLRRIGQRSLPLSNQFEYPQSAGNASSIYILDTGIEPNHVEFILPDTQCMSRVEWGYSSFDDAGDENGHGTLVASVAGGRYSGVAKLARLVSVRLFDANGESSLSQVIGGIQWVLNDVQKNSVQGRSVVNMSFGTSYSRALNRIVASLTSAGIPVVTAAGNEDAPACADSPASLSQAITVGATSIDDELSYFSNYGSCVDILAPGENIYGAALPNQPTLVYPLPRGCPYISSNETTDSGTSFSSPFVAGAVALYQTLGTFDNTGKSGDDYCEAVKDYLVNQASTNKISGLGFFSRTPNKLLYVN